jgi:hypothetical protein
MAKHTWNYRVVKHPQGHMALHEVHYEDGKPTGMTNDPITFGTDAYIVSESGDEAARQEVISALEMALRDAKKHPVVIPPEDWK